jgi:hypothetical protein
MKYIILIIIFLCVILVGSYFYVIDYNSNLGTILITIGVVGATPIIVFIDAYYTK